MRKLIISTIILAILSVSVYPRLASSQFIASPYIKRLPALKPDSGNVVIKNVREEEREEREERSDGSNVSHIQIPVVDFGHMALEDYMDRVGQLKNDFRMAVIAGIYNELLTADEEEQEKLREALEHLTSLNPEEWKQAKSILEEFDFYKNLVEEYETQIRKIAQNIYESSPNLSFRDTIRDLVKRYHPPYIQIPGVVKGYAFLSPNWKSFWLLFSEFQNQNIPRVDFEEFYNNLPDWIKDPWAEIPTGSVVYGEFNPNFRKVR